MKMMNNNNYPEHETVPEPEMEPMDEYCAWMSNPSNEYNCVECPLNRGMAQADLGISPCGQYNCWVTCSCYPEVIESKYGKS